MSIHISQQAGVWQHGDHHAPGRTSAAAQTEVLFKHATTQVFSCRMCEVIFLEVENDYKQALWEV